MLNAKTYWTIEDWAYEVEAQIGTLIFMVEGLNDILIEEGELYQFQLSSDRLSVICEQIDVEELPPEFRAAALAAKIHHRSLVAS